MQMAKVIIVLGTSVEAGLVIVVMVVLGEALGTWFVIDAEKSISVKSKQQPERRYFSPLFLIHLGFCFNSTVFTTSK